MTAYAHPVVLVETDWVADHLNDPTVRLVESNEDILLYDSGHIPGAVKLDWLADLNDSALRAFRDQVRAHIDTAGTALVDVRSPQEYSGERTHMPEYPQEGTLRGGHIPGAASTPWAKAVGEDGTFKSADDLQALYAPLGVTPDKDVITYCRIGERSSHSWFVVSYLLGYPRVRNYDGSWTEWGNAVAVPIEKGAPA